MQDKLLSDYERELITEKMKKSSVGGKASPDSGASSASTEKESVASDDWEKLSAGEKSPKKTAKEVSFESRSQGRET